MNDLKIEEQAQPRAASIGDGELGPEKAVLSKDEQHLANLGYKQGKHTLTHTSWKVNVDTDSLLT